MSDRRAWNEKVSSDSSYSEPLYFLKEDEAIIELVRKYGIRKWTIVSQKMEEMFMMKVRSGKQCRERFKFFFFSFPKRK